MKKALLLSLAAGVCCLAASPATAGGLYVYGSYWEVDDLGDAAGGGAMLAIPLGAAQRINLDLGATYFQQFEDDDFFDRLIDDEQSPFLENSVEVIPLDVGLSFNVGPTAPVNLTLGGGATYFLLDTDRGEVDDEAGWYARVGAELGGGGGGFGFFLAGVYRSAEVTVQNDPDDFRDVPDIEFEDETPFDLDGLGLNAGIVWRF